MVWACYENGGGEKIEEVLDVAATRKKTSWKT